MNRFELKQNFNIASTVINDNIRVSTVAIFCENYILGDYYQLETFIFRNNGRSNYKIHNVSQNQQGIDYCKRFHEKTVEMVKRSINKIYNKTSLI